MMKCLYCLTCPKFGQLIIRKIIRIVVTRCQIWGGKMYKIRFKLGLRSRAHLGAYLAILTVGAYSVPLIPWLHLRGPTSKGGEGEGG